ncbi:putative ribonuclease H-like domain-containing protein [Tanacetum coccineum]
MRPFGCPVTILNTIDHLGKFDGKADEGFFVGYSTNSKSFKEDLEWRTIPDKDYILLPFLTQDPSFSYSLKDSPNARFKPSREEEKIDVEHPENDIVSLTISTASIEDNVVDENIVYGCIDDPNMPNLEDIVYSDDDDEKVGAEADMNNLAITMPVSPIPTTRVHKDYPLEQIIRDIHSAPQTRRMTKNVTEHVEPKKVIQALQDPSWIEAMQEELLQFKLHQVWTLMELPYGKRAIGTKWVYRNKKDERGIVIRNKARLVAQGYTQEEGIDYDEVFALVARIEAIRLFLAYASFKDFVVYHMDVKSAFLYGKIEEEVYVYQPLGFEDPEFPDKVYKVEKALYGLHQAPRAWYETLSTYLLDNGFQRGQIDKTLFIKRVKATTPMKTSKPLLKDAEAEDVDVYLYRSMIGSLMYLIASRPDIMFDVCVCARFQVTPKVSHLHAAKRIFRYLKGVMDSKSNVGYRYNFKNTKIFIDNESTICIVKNPVFHSKTKHNEIRHHFIRDSYEKRLIQVIKIHTDHNVVDLLIKAFDVSRFQYLIANETIIKEWEDRMERSATTASSLEAKQDSGNINRTKSIATLNESFPQGTDSSSGPRYALTVNPTIYTICIEQFWATAKVNTVNGECQIQALVDKKRVIITEKSVRSDLMLEDAEGTECLPNDVIFERLTLMGRKQRKDSGPTKPIPDEATNEEHVSTLSYDLSQSGEDRLQLTELMSLCTSLQEKVLDLEEAKTSQAKEIGRKIANLDVDEEVTLIDETQERNDEEMLFDVQDDLQGEEVVAEKEVTEKKVSADDPVTTTGEVVTNANVEVTTASSPITTIDELTLAQTLIEIKAAKPKAITTAATTTTTTRPKARRVVVQEPSKFKTTSSSLQASQLP